MLNLLTLLGYEQGSGGFGLSFRASSSFFLFVCQYNAFNGIKHILPIFVVSTSRYSGDECSC